ncbi:MAG TPA: hypothetical protein VK797_29355 [Tepidisphaeraceae bacterium]|nr:hypothetical protein [Tepidisphaeraceae bacterium]
MKAIQLQSHVGADGVLSLRVPTGIRDTDVDVIVVVDRGNMTAGTAANPTDWAEFVRSTAGSITDPTFFRHEQGDFESREDLP